MCVGSVSSEWFCWDQREEIRVMQEISYLFWTHLENRHKGNSTISLPPVLFCPFFLAALFFLVRINRFSDFSSLPFYTLTEKCLLITRGINRSEGEREKAQVCICSSGVAKKISGFEVSVKSEEFGCEMWVCYISTSMSVWVRKRIWYENMKDVFRISIFILSAFLWSLSRLLSTGHSFTITPHLLLWSSPTECLPVMNLALAKLQKENDFTAAAQPFSWRSHWLPERTPGITTLAWL